MNSIRSLLLIPNLKKHIEPAQIMTGILSGHVYR